MKTAALVIVGLALNYVAAYALVVIVAARFNAWATRQRESRGTLPQDEIARLRAEKIRRK